VLILTRLWPAFGCFLRKFSAAAVDADFGPSWLSPNIFTTYLEAWAWSGCVSAAFALGVLFPFSHKEPAFSTFFIGQHISPHFDLISSDVLSLNAFCRLVNILQNSSLLDIL